MKDRRTGLPSLAHRVLKQVIPAQDFVDLNSHFEDLYENIVQSRGKLSAGIWLWKEIIKSLPGFIWTVLYWRVSMFKNYLTVALRNVKKYKIYSFINIAGLSLGMVVCMLIFLWVQNELGYDRFHTKKDSIAQVYSELRYSDKQSRIWMGSYYPLSKVLKEELPDIIEAARCNVARDLLIAHGERRFTNDVVGLADPSFFKIFTFQFVAGNPETALTDRTSAVLTETMARKYFGNEDPLGKTLTVNSALDIQVTGVISDIPSQSSLQFDCIVPFVLNFAPSFQEPEHWGGNPFDTYVLLPDNSDFAAIAKKITSVVKKHHPRETSEEIFHLHPLTKKHVYSPEGNSLVRSITIFSIIAFFVLVIACINFMNLSTAQAATRAREVGLRKVVGARKSDLVWQFIGESFAITLITLCIAVVLLMLLLPSFNQLLGKQLAPGLLLKPTVLIGFLSIALFTGFFAGSLPSFYISSFQPANILRGMSQSGLRSVTFRKILVVVQFSLSIFMIISMAVTFKQLRFLRHTDLGFDRENLVVFSATRSLRSHFESFRSELLKNPDVFAVTKSLQGPWNIGSTVSAVEWDGKNPEESVSMNWDYVDFDYFETLGINVIQGRSFSREHPTDLSEAYLVNEAAVKLMGMESPVGKRLSVFRKKGIIIGVVKNFHFQPMYHEIKPFVFILKPDTSSYTLARINPENTAGALKHIKTTYEEFEKNVPFDPFFFNDVLKRHIYSSELLTSKISGYFTLLAIMISCLGLFGLAAFMAERRTKEIGIRKVMGASMSSVVFMLSKDFTKLVLLANVFAWPAAYFILQKMLSRYAYRIGIGVELFMLSGIAALLVALAAVSYHAFRAAKENPAESLRYE